MPAELVTYPNILKFCTSPPAPTTTEYSQVRAICDRGPSPDDENEFTLVPLVSQPLIAPVEHQFCIEEATSDEFIITGTPRGGGKRVKVTGEQYLAMRGQEVSEYVEGAVRQLEDDAHSHVQEQLGTLAHERRQSRCSGDLKLLVDQSPRS